MKYLIVICVTVLFVAFMKYYSPIVVQYIQFETVQMLAESGKKVIPFQKF